jgi:hypothetical protein
MCVFGISALVTLGLAVGCSSPQPATFHPAAAASSDPASAAPAPAGTSAGGLIQLPFGSGVHIVMPATKSAGARHIPAVQTAQNFLLAFLYSEYRGGADRRWQSYTAGLARTGLRESMSEPSVTTESFTGTIRFSHLRAFADPSRKGAIDVAECFDSSRADNTNLNSGQVIPDRTPADQHFYRNTDMLVRTHGRWRITVVYPVVYYPRAKECKP